MLTDLSIETVLAFRDGKRFALDLVLDYWHELFHTMYAANKKFQKHGSWLSKYSAKNIINYGR